MLAPAIPMRTPRRRACVGAIVCLGTWLAAGLAWAAETPEQFRLWGKQGPEFKPAPAGWTEVPGDAPPAEAAKPSDQDRARGFILFQRKALEEVYPDTVPAPFEARALSLQAFAAQGEYEPLTFALHALEDLRGCRVEIGAWKTADGEAFPTNHVDVRVVRAIRSKANYASAADKRFRWAPFLLEKREAFDVAKGRTAQVWLTVKVPDTAKPGDYRGTVQVQAPGKAPAEVPVTLRVLPFRLPPVPIEAVMSYAKRADDLALREKELVDQREHGINNLEAGVGAYVVSRDQNFGDDDVAATRKNIRENLALRKKVYGEAAARFPVTAEVGHQILYYWNVQKGWFDYWPRGEKMEADFVKAIKLVEETVKAEGVGAPRIFVMDEPGGNPLVKETAYYNRFVKQKFPHLTTWCTIGGGLSMGIDEVNVFDGVDEFSTNRFTPDICRALLDRKKPYGVYNGGSSSEEVGPFIRDRHFFGFYCWRTGASEILQWVYAFGEPWNDPIRGNHGYVYPSPDGPLPSIPWESVREGLDDYRYADLLWRLITAARKSGDAQAAAAAKAAEETCAGTMSRIGLHYQGLSSSTPPAAAGQMERWRWQVVAAILSLLKHVPQEKALAAAAERPGPFEIAFPKDDAAAKYGAELLPASGFEEGPGVWKVSGQGGSGGLDEAEHHGGAKSFKLANPAGCDGNIVTVCVWGWGGPGPTMTLAAGKTYEFSAWIKGGRPSLRVALPKGGARREEDGPAESAANGWNRISRRVTMGKDEKPGYLAVWLQGPGTIWCDDLSLKEIELPPFNLTVSQTLVDDSDRVVPVSVSQPGGNAAIQVRVQLAGGKGDAVTLSVPPGGQAAAKLPAEGLALGPHELKAELVGESAFARTVTVQRVKGPFE